ncbi:hypothetical protein RD792_016722 [Penstemon davidsonii]|uniref:Uncharacterized protein n=1 Tax=Penstemon davidsonii TaxID=160366 RepID=A0ABR0CK48_9LAMI|nr:hypothetical protein RD792_016722 [Penstemon davidsonii]
MADLKQSGEGSEGDQTGQAGSRNFGQEQGGLGWAAQVRAGAGVVTRMRERKRVGGREIDEERRWEREGGRVAEVGERGRKGGSRRWSEEEEEQEEEENEMTKPDELAKILVEIAEKYAWDSIICGIEEIVSMIYAIFFFIHPISGGLAASAAFNPGQFLPRLTRPRQPSFSQSQPRHTASAEPSRGISASAEPSRGMSASAEHSRDSQPGPRSVEANLPRPSLAEVLLPRPRLAEVVLPRPFSADILLPRPRRSCLDRGVDFSFEEEVARAICELPPCDSGISDFLFSDDESIYDTSRHIPLGTRPDDASSWVMDDDEDEERDTPSFVGSKRKSRAIDIEIANTEMSLRCKFLEDCPFAKGSRGPWKLKYFYAMGMPISEIRAGKGALRADRDPRRPPPPPHKGTQSGNPRGSSVNKGASQASRSAPSETLGTIMSSGRNRQSSPPSKHPRENTVEVSPRPGAGKGLFIFGINKEKGVGSFWDSADLELGYDKTRQLISAHDANRFDQFPSENLDKILCADVARIPLLSHLLTQRAKRFEEKAKTAEEKLVHMTKQLQELKLENNRLSKDLKHEVQTGEKFRKSEQGKEYYRDLEKELVIKYQSSLEKELVSNYQNFDAYREDLLKESILVYDRTIRDICKILRDSGHFPGEVFMFIDPEVDDEADLEEEKGTVIPDEVFEEADDSLPKDHAPNSSKEKK